MLDGLPISAAVGLVDGHWTDSAADDSPIAGTSSNGQGQYALTAEVRADGCGGRGGFGSQYYLVVRIDGVVSDQTAERVHFGAVEQVRCEVGQTINFRLELPAGFTRP
jgi:hypothetical protein